MAGLLKTSAITLAAALSTAASAQTFEPWDDKTPPQDTRGSVAQTYPAPGYHDRPLSAVPSADQRCRDLVQFQKPQKVFEKAKTSFLQADTLACRFTYVLDQQKPLLEESYQLNDTKQVKALSRDLDKAQRAEDRFNNTRGSKTEGESSERPRRRQRGEPHAASSVSHMIGRPAASSGGPGKRDESLEDLRARRYRESGLTPP